MGAADRTGRTPGGLDDNPTVEPITDPLEGTEPGITLAPATDARRRGDANLDTPSSIGRNLARGSAWWLVARALGAVASLAASAALARLLDPAELGAYFLVFSIVTVGSVVGRVGLPRAATRLIAEELAMQRRHRARGAVRSVLMLAAAGSTTVAILLVTGPGGWLARSVLHAPLVAGALGLAAVWMMFEVFRIVLAEMFRGFHEVRVAAFVNDPGRWVLTAVALAAVASRMRSTTLEVVVVAMTAASAAVVLIGAVRLVPRLRAMGRCRRYPLTAVLAVSLPLMVTDLTGAMLSQGDLWVVSAFRAATDVAVYGAASRLAVLPTVSLNVVNALIAPWVTRLHVQGRHADMQDMLRAASTAATVPTVLVFAVLLFAGGPVMALVFGEFARPGSTVLVLLALGQVVNVAAGSCAITLMMTGFQRLVMGVSLVSLVVAVGGEIVGARLAGITGVAVASAAAIAVQNILLTIMARRRLGIWTHATLRLRSVRRLAALKS